MNARRWQQRPPGSNWGDFGEADEHGRLNLITPACVRAAAAEVKEGLRFCLSLPLDRPGGNYHDLGRQPPRLTPMLRKGRVKYHLQSNAEHPDVFSDDAVLLYSQFSTHWDALAHVGSMFDADGDGVPEVRYWNGFHASPAEVGDDRAFPGTRTLGVERLAETGLQGRGVLVDLQRAFGNARRAVDYDDLMRAIDDQRIVIESGDILCLHTGQTAVLLAQGQRPDRHWLEEAFCHLDGCDDRLLDWIAVSGIAAIAADNFAVEAVPPVRREKGRAYERLHELCLFKLGLPLGELWFLADLAEWLHERQRSRFLLTAPPLRLPGAVGAPVTPVATV
ncbi:MAG TPA: cyclase family protein [Casimicrobiaceae bacterium]|nr:cyclase family protein [Casimicrobiaceae bacterium]